MLFQLLIEPQTFTHFPPWLKSAILPIWFTAECQVSLINPEDRCVYCTRGLIVICFDYNILCSNCDCGLLTRAVRAFTSSSLFLLLVLNAERQVIIVPAFMRRRAKGFAVFLLDMCHGDKHRAFIQLVKINKMLPNLSFLQHLHESQPSVPARCDFN